MAEIAPLTPLRYDPSKLPLGLASVVAPPYDVISPLERTELAARDPHNVVRLILPEGEGDTRYAHASLLLNTWVTNGVLVRDPEPGIYRYDQTYTSPSSDGGPSEGEPVSRSGFFALVKLVPFDAGIVLPHEKTLSGPKEDRLKLFRATRANLSPGFMLYRDAQNVLDGPLKDGKVIADFATQDRIRHRLSKVTGRDAVRAIVDHIATSTLLIADGHHRYETALRYSREVEERYPSGADSRPEHRYFMTFLSNGDDPKLRVLATHRLVHSLGSFSALTFLEAARELFDVVPLPSEMGAPAMLNALKEAGLRRPAFVVATQSGAAMLTLLEGIDLSQHPALRGVPHVLRDTEVAVLHAGILEYLLGITKEAQEAKRHLTYPQNASVALAEVRAGKGNALFLMNPTRVEQVRLAAEAGEVMPQKSTFFYPKVLTGLLLHTLDPLRRVAPRP